MFTFFQQTATRSLPVLPACGACGQAEKCKFPKLRTKAESATTVIVIDGIPEDKPTALRRLTGQAKTFLYRVGWNPDTYSIIPATACYGANAEAWKHCQPLVVSEIRRLNPEKVVVIGYEALQSVIGHLWREPAAENKRWYGQVIPSRELNAWVFPVDRKRYKANPQVSDMWVSRWLKQAKAMTGRPYTDVPDYEKQYEIVRDTEKLREKLLEAGEAELSAFDFETTGLKPEMRGHEIVSCSVAWLRDGTPFCVAFMVDSDEVLDILREYLLSDSRKIAANAKFELRWTARKLGVRVKNMFWDTVVAAHIEDPQKGAAGTKFQAFASLGVPFYAGDAERYFESDDQENGANGVNNIHMADSHSLLRYNAIDSLVELDLGILQIRRAGLADVWSSNLPESYRNINL